MIKDNQQYFNKLHVLIDALVIIVSYVFAWWLKFLSGILDHEVGVLSFEFYMRALLLIVPVYICCIMRSICTRLSACRGDGWSFPTL